MKTVTLAIIAILFTYKAHASATIICDGNVNNKAVSFSTDAKSGGTGHYKVVGNERLVAYVSIDNVEDLILLASLADIKVEDEKEYFLKNARIHFRIGNNKTSIPLMNFRSISLQNENDFLDCKVN